MEMIQVKTELKEQPKVEETPPKVEEKTPKVEETPPKVEETPPKVEKKKRGRPKKAQPEKSIVEEKTKTRKKRKTKKIQPIEENPDPVIIPEEPKKRKRKKRKTKDDTHLIPVVDSLHLAVSTLASFAVKAISKDTAELKPLNEAQIVGLRPTGVEALRYAMDESEDTLNPMEIHLIMMVVLLVPNMKLYKQPEIIDAQTEN